MTKTYAERCNNKDDARRKAAGWCDMAWVGVNFEPPRDEHEAWALALIKGQYTGHINVHVYTLVDLLANVRRANKGTQCFTD